MKNSTLILLFFVGFLTMSFTTQETIWLDKDLNKTSQSKAEYYRLEKKLEGQISFFYKNRTVYRKVFYNGDKLNGKFLEYYKTGELRMFGKYENGLREGVWKEYYRSGKIKKRGKYSNGDKVGIWKIFYKNI